MPHQSPDEDLECAVCFCEITQETYCEYKIHSDDHWTPSPLCTFCVDLMRKEQWGRFVNLVEKADCRASLLRLCRKVPLCVHDSMSFICPTHGKDCESQGELNQLWIAEKNEVITPILEGAKTGKEREDYIKHLYQYADLLEDAKSDEIREMGLDH